MLASCSAQQRLSRFLQRHPELRHIDTVALTDTIRIIDTLYLKADTNSIMLTIDDIKRMDSVANNTTPAESSQEVKQTAENNHSKATLTATGDGKFLLSAITKPDTVILQDTLYKPRFFFIPSYITKTEYKDREVYKMHWYQHTLCGLGVIFLIIMIIGTILHFK